MTEYEMLAREAERAGQEIFWYGATDSNQIERVEALLHVTLPISYKKFLENYGGGGVVSAEVCGVEDNDASIESGGTVVGDTKECRERFALPDNLVVIYFHGDEVCWCLDLTNSNEEDSPVVSYNIFTGKIDRQIASNFSSFMRQHLTLYGK
ncbi:SMI1/KNR4 family protein [Achromobacter pestifer]